jgi:DegV family protein with EDD domain
MSQRIALVTDSTCDIPLAWREQYEIQVVPLSIIFGDETYLDGIELTAKEFYKKLVTDPRHPTTSQPSQQLFLDAFSRAHAGGAEHVVVFTISASMSGTIASARLAAQESPIPVEIADSRNNSMGLGWQVMAAARMREKGGDLSAILSAAETVRDKMAYYITLDTINYLARGGRIADAARLVNGVLQIKPLIYVRPDKGTVGAGIPSRSRKSAIEGLFKEFYMHVDVQKPVHVCVLHNDAEDEAEAMLERLRIECNLAEAFIQIVSPVLGVHTGPKALALCGYSE